MQNEMNPVVVWAVIGVIVVGLIGFFIWRGHAPSKMETGGSENAMEQFKKTGTFYQPPAGAPVQGAPGSPMGGPGGGYSRPPAGAPGSAPR